MVKNDGSKDGGKKGDAQAKSPLAEAGKRGPDGEKSQQNSVGKG